MAQNGDAAPRDFAALKDLVIARSASLPRRLAQVATYALANPDDIAFGTAASIAAAADVQPSTLVRFSQALDYEGFSDFQDVFRSRLRVRVLSYQERLAQMREHGLSPSQTGLLLDGFSDAASRSIDAFRHSLDAITVEKAVDLLSGAEIIYLIGLRRSFPLTSYIAYAMGKLGIRNILVDGLAGLGQEQVGFVGPNDAVLAVSFAPYASETVALTAAAAQRQASIVAITDSAFSPLASISDVWMEVLEANFEGFRSMAATMALAMALTVAVAQRRSHSA